ncbi:MAG TPA: LCP family protein [Propionibacterium sp.]|nr:LCP family protein [Propionibacterium sp.]
MSDGISLFSEDPDRDVDRAPDKRGPRRAARRGRRRKPLLIALVSLLVLLLGAGVLVGWYFQRIESALSGIAREDFMPGSSAASGGGGGAGDSAPRALPPPVGTNYVLMGSDSRGPDQGRSDTLMIAHVTAAKDKVYLISFPRDMWVDIPGRGKGKINWAYAFGGPELTVRTLNDLTGVPMDHAAVVDFEGFIKVTEALGGVEVFNKRAFRAGSHYFPEGIVNLKGEEALAYVRERYNLPRGDLDRAENQRDVVRAIIDKAARPSVLANPVVFDGMLDQLSGSLRVDSGLTNEKIKETAMSMRLQGGQDVISFQAPITGLGWAGDQSIAVVDEAKMADLGTALREDRLHEYLAENP